MLLLKKADRLTFLNKIAEDPNLFLAFISVFKFPEWCRDNNTGQVHHALKNQTLLAFLVAPNQLSKMSVAYRPLDKY